MISAVAYFVIATQRSDALERPMPPDRVIAIFGKAGRSPYAAGPTLEIAKKLWPASDKELVKYVATYPQETIQEACYRFRPSVIPVYDEAIRRVSKGYVFEALLGLDRLRTSFPDCGADQAIERALQSSNQEAKLGAAVLVGNRDRARTVPLMRQVMRRDSRFVRVFAASLVLESCIGDAALPEVRSAYIRLQKTHDDSYANSQLLIVCVRLGDDSAIPDARRLALQRGRPHLAISAIENLAARFGLREKITLRKALFSGAVQRLQASRWLLHLGDRGAINSMRAAARSQPHDVANSSSFPTFNSVLNDNADKLERGPLGPRPEPFHKSNKPSWWWSRA